MASELGMISIGVLLTGWGIFLVHDLLGMARAWTQVDEMFPPALRSSPVWAGRLLLVIGTLLVVAPLLA